MNDIPSNYIELQAQASRTVALRKSRAFRRKLFFTRFNAEVLHGKKADRRDFARFVANKLHLTKCKARPQADFDPTNGEELHAAEVLISDYTPDKGRRQAVIFSRLQYYTSGCGQRGAQLAKTFAKLGYDVLFFYADDNYYSFDRDFIKGLSLHLPVEYLTPERLIPMLGPDTIAIFEHPDHAFLPYLNGLKAAGITTVYEHIDNWESELGAGWYDRENYLAFIGTADILSATARNLCEMVERDSGRRVNYCANAVDIDLFDPTRSYERPEDLPQGGKTLLYYGHLSGNWLDWDLLYDTAALCPDCVFAVIGYGKVSSHRKAPSNVRFLGVKQQAELPAYLACSDFAVLHFNTLEVGSYVSPLKVFEYLAMHKRVLAAPLPDIAGYPNVICSADPADWAAAIEDPPAEEPYDDFVAANSWRARCRQLIKEADSL